MNKGFTLIELLVVVLIIGILSAVALPQYTKAVEKSRATEAMTLLGNLATAEEVYKMSTGTYTNDLSVLDLQLPGVGSTSTKTVSTKNFKLDITAPRGNVPATGGTLTATATRMVGTSAGTGDLAYVLNLSIDANGNITRTCTGSSTTCKSIANGATCSGTSSSNKDWCYKAS